jgi:nitrite reductase/ring-hydroxylating ferredoxin subunit/DNA-directed RNA polymerase subunit RPC12/RpoP
VLIWSQELRDLNSTDLDCPTCGNKIFVDERASAGMIYDCVSCGSELELHEDVAVHFKCRISSETPHRYETLGHTIEVPPGQNKVFQIGNREIVVFAVDGQYFAMKNLCPHHGVALSGGTLENGTVRCPGHGFRFDIRTGQCEKDPSLRASIMDLKVEDGKLLVRIG